VDGALFMGIFVRFLIIDLLSLRLVSVSNKSFWTNVFLLGCLFEDWLITKFYNMILMFVYVNILLIYRFISTLENLLSALKFRSYSVYCKHLSVLDEGYFHGKL